MTSVSISRRDFRSLLAVAVATCAALIPMRPAFAQTPEQIRQSIARYLQQAARAAETPASTDTAPFDPGALLASGKQMWERKFPDGRSLASCFPNGGRRVAATYPQFDSRAKQVVTLPMAINRCLQLHGQSEIAFSETAGDVLLAYARSLSEGERINVRILNSAARAKFDAGRRLFYTRLGASNQACASCHVLNAGKIFNDRPLQGATGQATQWPWTDSSGNLVSLQAQYRRCMQRTGAEPFPLNGEILNDLEFFHTYLSNALPVRPLQPH